MSMVEYLYIGYLAVSLLSSLKKNVPTKKTIKMTETSASVCLALYMARSRCAYAYAINQGANKLLGPEQAFCR